MVVVIASVTAAVYDRRRSQPSPYRNIIVMVSDGYGPAGQTLCRYTSLADDNYTVIFDEFIVGNVRTRSYNSLVTDSAAGATAYATGFKTNNTGVSVDPMTLLPYGTLLEAAKYQGMAAGLVVKSTLSDATPAAFSSHRKERYNQTAIALQQITHNIEVMFGGGKQYYDVDAWKKAGYKFIETSSDMQNTKTTPVLGLFSHTDLDYVIDRTPNTTQPTLPQMVEKALELLSGSPTGFFLLIEGSLIDRAGHENDPATYYGEAREYDETMRMVNEWASKAEGETLVVSVSDHETGGLTLGRVRDGDPGGYPPYEWDPYTLLQVTKSSQKMAPLIRSSNGTNTATVIQTYTNIQPTQEQVDLINHGINDSRALIVNIGKVVSTQARIGWTTPGHTGVDINLYVVYDSQANVGNQPKIQGNMENTAVGNAIASKCSLDLVAATEKIRTGWNPEWAVDPPKSTMVERDMFEEEDNYHPRLQTRGNQ